MGNFPITHNPLDEFEKRLDWIINSLSDMCDAPITVWIEKLWKPLGELILTWYALDLKNIFTAYLRPGLFAIEGRSTRHWGRGEKGKRRTGFSKSWERVGTVVGWDPNEVLGKGLWGGDELRARPLPPGAQYLWIFEGVIERLLFYWMVVDLGTTFLYNWMSAVEETKYCLASRDAVFTGKMGPHPLLGLFGWDPQGPFVPQKMRNISFFNGFGVGASGGMGSAGGSALVTIPPEYTEPVTVECRIRCLTGPSAGAEVYSSHTIEPSHSAAVGCGTAIQSGDVVIFEIRVPSFVQCDEATLFYQQVYVVPQ